MGSAAEAGKIPAGCSLGTPLLSPGRREAADAAAMTSSMSREALACVASAAQKVGRISDMLEVVNMMAKIGSPLTREEVELISATYGRVLSDKHNAWRTISIMEDEEQHSGKSAASVGLEVYREVLEKDMDTTCRDVLHIFQHHLLPSCSGEDNVALYTKMLGCINWILTLLTKVEDKELHVESTVAAYEAASKAIEKLGVAMAVPEAAAAAAAAAALGRKGLVAIIRMAYDANRHSDMFVLVNKLAEMHTEFSAEERKLFVIAYRCTFSAKLRALGVISATKEGQDDPEKAKCVMFYRAVLERDIQATCRETLDIVDKHLLPFSCAAENTVLFTNTKADAYWFLAMLKMEEDNKQLLVDKALTAYEATSKAAESLSAVHPLLHALHLTKTALFYDVKEWPELATALAKLALDKAGPELPSLHEESYKKIAEIIGIKEENLKLWEPTCPNNEESYKKSAEIMGLMKEKLKLWEPTSPNSKDYSDISSKLTSVSLEEEPSYSGGSPSPPPPPVVPHPAGPPVAPNEFISPGDWGYDVHEGLTPREIRFRKKAAQIKRGFMG